MWYQSKHYEPIPTHQQYLISRTGEVYSFEKKRLLKGSFNNGGYGQVWLTDNKGNARWERRHRLVALVYLPNQSGLLEVNHIDGNKFNNADTNLQWTTRSANMQHAHDTGLMPKTCGVQKGFKHTNATCKKMSNKKLGKKHPKYIGQFITPWGEYASANQAGNANSVQPKTVMNRCKSSRWKPLGYDFIPK